MSIPAPTPKTVARQHSRKKPQADAEQPTLAIVDDEPQPDKAQAKHPKVNVPSCGATQIYAGKQVACTRERFHPGNHQRGGIYWRPRSGD
jgi:hypothetical protein